MRTNTIKSRRTMPFGRRLQSNARIYGKFSTHRVYRQNFKKFSNKISKKFKKNFQKIFQKKKNFHIKYLGLFGKNEDWRSYYCALLLRVKNQQIF